MKRPLVFLKEIACHCSSHYSPSTHNRYASLCTLPLILFVSGSSIVNAAVSGINSNLFVP